ncbi:MAG: Maf family nucleotide pyrophosphatase [Planctomycetes bacterium]|jgi:MAF protein|nr:Maf family nucleotide pyrophosphatase [Planctomycetota bacterium]
MNVVLASGSPRRAKLLSEAGVRFETVVPDVSEDPSPGATAAQAAAEAARRKAEFVAASRPESLVLAADTLVVVEGRALGKPASLDVARAMLRALSGRAHAVVTAVCLDWRVRGLLKRFAVETEVRFRPLSAEDVEAYLSAVHVLDKAGAYAIQERPELLGAEVRGSLSNVIGLPVEETLAALRQAGWSPRGEIPIPGSRIPNPAARTPVHIGPLSLRNPFLLGGLSGYSDRFLREACLRLGASAAVTPMLLDKGIFTARRRGPPPPAAGEAEHPVIVQLLGETPEGMARAAAILEPGGFDALEVNLACPSHKILRRRRGGAILRTPGHAVAILKAVRDAVRLPLLVKIRRGFDDAPEAADRAWAVLEGALSVPVDAVTIHPRTVAQKYKGPSDWSFLAEARRRFPDATLIGSGDLFTAADGLRMLRETGVDAVAFGRGAIANPWIFRQAVALLEGREDPRPSGPELFAHFDAYKRSVLARLEEKPAMNHLRKECIQASRHVLHARKARIAFAAARTPEEFDAAMRAVFLEGTAADGSEPWSPPSAEPAEETCGDGEDAEDGGSEEETTA